MPPVATLVRQVEERARRDPDFAEVLGVLLDAPTTSKDELEHVAARLLNDERRGAVMSDFVEGAFPTDKVQAMLKYETPQAVHNLRSRGKLLGLTDRNHTWFPRWQFENNRLRPDLAKILELLGRFTSDPLVADRIMRIKREELAGASIATALGRKKTASTAWQMLAAVGA